MALIGHDFSDDTLLRTALVHASFDARAGTGPMANNERLEFLGDRVLGLVISELLFAAYPQSDEGDLARRFNALVRKETCARVAREINLGKYLFLGEGEDRAGGRGKMAVLGNACEALIAAIYLDGGLAAARRFIERFWRPHLRSVKSVPRDAKTALQEWAQSRRLARPSYRVTARSGPEHAPVFTISVEIEGYDAVRGEGTSKQAAEQVAAKRFLKRNDPARERK